jgi:hypothetical protein
VPADALEAARAAVQAEADGMKLEAMVARHGDGGDGGGGGGALGARALAAAGAALDAAYAFVPGPAGGLLRRAALSDGQRAAAARAAFAGVAASFAREAGRLAKVEARNGVLTKGYEARARAAAAALAALAQAGRDKAIEHAAAVRLAHDEAAALPRRLADATAAHDAAAAREAALQAQYRAALAAMADLRGRLRAAGVDADAAAP